MMGEAVSNITISSNPDCETTELLDLRGITTYLVRECTHKNGDDEGTFVIEVIRPILRPREEDMAISSR